jgi:glycosyltransferase involved in cell wall biosynthesis
MYARAYRKVILLTSVTDYQRVEKELAAMGIRNVSLVVIRMPLSLDRLHSVPVGGIHLHYWLWLGAAKRAVRRLRETVDFAHHITYGSLQFGSPIYELQCPFIFGPVGGGQVTNKVFYPLMGKARYIEGIRNLVSTLFYRFNPFFKGTMAHASLIYCTNRETYVAASNYLPAHRQDKLRMLNDTLLDDRFLASAPPVKKNAKRALSALWVGRLIPRKGIEVLLNTALLLKDENFTLTMVGDGPLREKTLHFIKTHGLENTIRFAGHIDQQQILEYYRNADILLFLSYRDSAGLQIAEANSQGVPCISFDQFGAAMMINEETGVKIPIEGTVEEMQEKIAEAIRELGRQPEKLAEMGRRAVDSARVYSWAIRRETILQDIKPLLLHEDASMRLERV